MEITGRKSKHKESNENGFVTNHRYRKRNVDNERLFKQKDKGTWIIPTTTQTNRIDHLLIMTYFVMS